jgi:hypothetical protein
VAVQMAADRSRAAAACSGAASSCHRGGDGGVAAAAAAAAPAVALQQAVAIVAATGVIVYCALLAAAGVAAPPADLIGDYGPRISGVDDATWAAYQRAAEAAYVCVCAGGSAELAEGAAARAAAAQVHGGADVAARNRVARTLIWLVHATVRSGGLLEDGLLPTSLAKPKSGLRRLTAAIAERDLAYVTAAAGTDPLIWSAAKDAAERGVWKLPNWPMTGSGLLIPGGGAVAVALRL